MIKNSVGMVTAIHSDKNIQNAGAQFHNSTLAIREVSSPLKKIFLGKNASCFNILSGIRKTVKKQTVKQLCIKKLEFHSLYQGMLSLGSLKYK